MSNNIKVEITGLKELAADLNKLPEATERGAIKAAQDIRDAWKHSLMARAGYDSGDYYDSIETHITPLGAISVDTSNNYDVVYSDVFERGRKDRPAYYGRYPLHAAMDWIDSQDLVQTRIVEEFDDVLKGN